MSSHNDCYINGYRLLSIVMGTYFCPLTNYTEKKFHKICLLWFYQFEKSIYHSLHIFYNHWQKNKDGNILQKHFGLFWTFEDRKYLLLLILPMNSN